MSTAAQQTTEGHVTGETKTTRANRLKLGVAQKKAAESGALYDHVLEDVVLLLGELGKVQQNEVDRPSDVIDLKLVAELRKKYGQPLT